MKRIINYNVRPTLPEEIEADMPYVTSSMVEALNTCPRWGLINNVQSRSFTTGYRQMALEAGSLMHDVFAAFNFYSLAVTQELPEHANYHASQLFGKDRWDFIDFTNLVKKKSNPLEALAYAMIASSEFYDDPDDKNRTLANLEHCAVMLADYFLMNHVKFPIYVADPEDCTAPVGVEQSLDVVFEIEYDNGEVRPLRFIGLADTVYHNTVTNNVTLGEYKTASSMNDAWLESFRTRHQLSAYTGALEASFDNVSFNTILTGSAVPVRKTTAPVQHFSIERDRSNVMDFLFAADYATHFIEAFQGVDAVAAPMFTHSCNRYFRPCAMLDLCSSDKVDQVVMWEQMHIKERSPSEMKALLRQNG